MSLLARRVTRLSPRITLLSALHQHAGVKKKNSSVDERVRSEVRHASMHACKHASTSKKRGRGVAKMDGGSGFRIARWAALPFHQMQSCGSWKEVMDEARGRQLLMTARLDETWPSRTEAL